jgi:hypothetical protein
MGPPTILKGIDMWVAPAANIVIVGHAIIFLGGIVGHPNFFIPTNLLEVGGGLVYSDRLDM